MENPEQILKRVRIAAPCPANWDNMEGDERKRYCALCKLNVYNLSDMTAREAARLVSESEGRLCIRFYQRRDGTVLTRDCPVGVRALRKRLASTVACVFVLFTAGIAYASSLGRRGSLEDRRDSMIAEASQRIRRTEPFKTILDWIDPPQPVVTKGMTAYPGSMVFLPPPAVGRVVQPPAPGNHSTP
jgi:hypothetical protein